jgi:hypothetical protein
VAPHPQQPWYFVVGAHDNHQFLPYQRFSLQLPAQLLAVEGGKRSTSVAGALGAIELLGESSTSI